MENSDNRVLDAQWSSIRWSSEEPLEVKVLGNGVYKGSCSEKSER